MKKKTAVIFLVVVLLLGNLSIVYGASSTSEPNPDIWGTAKKWLGLGESQYTQTGLMRDSEWDYFSQLNGILWGAGIFVILIWGTILGIKYMFASVDDKADVKKGLTPLAVGSAIIIGALTIWQIVVNLLEGVSY